MLKLSIDFSLRFNLLTDKKSCKLINITMSDPLSLAAAENFDNNDNFVKYLISNDNNNNQKKSNQDNEIETNVDETPPEVPIRTKRSNKQSNKTNNDDVIIDKPSIIIAPGSLHPNHVRWFYKEDSNTTKWTPFKGYDSISLELEFRRNESSQNYETVQILDNLYEANIQLRKYYPIYWDGKFHGSFLISINFLLL